MKNYIKRVDETVTLDTQNNQYFATVSHNIPKVKINTFIKRVKEQGGVDLREVLGEREIVELLIKYLVDNVDAETIPLNAVYPIDMGDGIPKDGQAQGQPNYEDQPQSQVDIQSDTVEDVQQPQSQGQVQTEEFEKINNEALPTSNDGGDLA
jgi:hypothetical protein